MSKGGRDRYGQENQDQENKLVPEGIEGRVPYKDLFQKWLIS